MYCTAALQLTELFDEAVAEYLKTISLNDQHQLAYYNLGYIYFNNLKRAQEGVKMLKKCLEIDPTDVDAQINMALAFNDLGMIDDVIRSYKYIIQHNDKSVMAHFNLGECVDSIFSCTVALCLSVLHAYYSFFMWELQLAYCLTDFC